MQCTNNLKQIGLGLHNYHSGWNTFPVGFLYAYTGVLPNSSPLQYRWSVLAQMAPQLEQANLFNALNFNFPVAHQPTSAGALFWPYFPANTTVMADNGGALPLPKRRCSRPDNWLRPDELCLLLGRRLRRWRCDRRQWCIHSGTASVGCNRDRRDQRDRGGLRAIARNRRPVLTNHANTGSHTLAAGNVSRDRKPADRCKLVRFPAMAGS